MAARKYRYMVTLPGVAQEEYFPISNDGLELDPVRQDGQDFFVNQLNGVLTFTRKEADNIIALSLEDKVEVLIEERQSDGSWATWFEGFFYKTDAETIDTFRRQVSVKLRPVNRYEKVLEALDKEFNLIDLAPELTPVTITKGGILQLYVAGGQFINNYLGGIFWEEEVTSPTADKATLENDYDFNADYERVIVTGSEKGISPDVTGVYEWNGVDRWVRTDGVYSLSEFVDGLLSKGRIREVSSGTTVFETNDLPFDTDDPFFIGAPFISETDFSVRVSAFYVRIACRIITDQEVVGGVPTVILSPNDISPDNANYNRVLPYDPEDILILSDLSSADPTEYGKFAPGVENYDGEYFRKLLLDPATGIGETFPISPSEWVGWSGWVYFPTILELILENDASTEVTIQNAYFISHAISAILREVDPTVTHEPDSDHSQFFYSVPNTIRGNLELYPFMVPKSNIKTADYTKPAQTAKIQLQQIFDFLKNFYKVKWDIDENNRLILEHEEYFDRGKTYGSANVGIDLTTYIDARSGKPWDHAQVNFRYEKIQMPERTEAEWMDDSSKIFEGLPIEYTSVYVDQGNVEKLSLTPFTADVSLVLARPNLVSDEGFVFLEAELDGGNYVVPFVTLTLEGRELKVQNGYGSIVWAFGQYHRYLMAGEDANINGEASTAITVRKSRVQEVVFPAQGPIDYQKLVTTSLGNGRIKEIKINQITGLVTATLYHANE